MNFKSVVGASYRPLAAFVVFFLGVALLTRIVLLTVCFAQIPHDPLTLLSIFLIGLGYDVLAAVYFTWPLVLWLWLAPRRLLRSGIGRAMHAALIFTLVFVVFFVAAAEWTFWDEFQTRFNFIAVDYLVYTNEVIGNIRESYPIGAILGGLTALSLFALWAGRRYWPVADTSTRLRARGGLVVAWLAISVLGTWWITADMKDRGENQHVDDLAGNGVYQFFAAYHNSTLDYQRFYRTVPMAEAYAELRQLLATPDAHFVSDDPVSIARDIKNEAPEQHLNVVLISIESLSAAFSGQFGRKPSLTPELDRLTPETLFFSRLYASGTRTVRGLEALSLSVPPTPGESIVKRPGNENLFSLASVFNGKGYHSEFLYGGYGAFDNMNYFFGHNGYEVHDRADIPDERIHHATIWGVADEDLYTLAIDRFDAAHSRGEPFFAHIMTTSNHRPYTFPTGRVDMPQGERDSAVVYTDWAIGDFLRRARGKPWFDDTVFVITADHCASSGGIARLPVFRYHIPMWIYSPKHITPGRFDRMMAQIDIGPTVLGLLGMDYRSEFYGADIFQLPEGRERVLIGNYQRLGYIRNDELIELAPHRVVNSAQPDYVRDSPQPTIPLDSELASQAIAYYQTAYDRFASGAMRIEGGEETSTRRASALPPEP